MPTRALPAFPTAPPLPPPTTRWIYSLLLVGYRRPLTPDDIPAPGPQDNIVTCGRNLRDALEAQRTRGRPRISLLWALNTAFGRVWWAAGLGCRLPWIGKGCAKAVRSCTF